MFAVMTYLVNRQLYSTEHNNLPIDDTSLHKSKW